MPRNSSRRTRVRAVGVPLVALIVGAALGAGAMRLWGGDGASSQEAFAARDDSRQTLAVSLQTLEESVEASGTLSAVASSELAFDASGEVTAVYVEAGDKVDAGDVIAEIDTLQLTASLRSAEADLAKAEAQLADLEDAADGSDSSDAQIAAASSQVAVLEQSVDDAEDAMGDAQLVADIAGLVTSQPYSVGDVVSGGSSSTGGSSMGTTTAASSSSTSSSGVTIVGEDEWTVSVSLSEDEVAQIAEGDQVTFLSDDVDDEFFGIVTEIANLPTTTGGSATYAVELQVTGTVEGLYDGTSVTADIVYLRQSDVLAIPTNAITTSDGVSTVTVVDDEGDEEVREVTLGDSIDSYTIVTEGLDEGESIAVTTTVSSSDSTTSDDFGDMSGQMPGGDFGGQMPSGGMGAMPGR